MYYDGEYYLSSLPSLRETGLFLCRIIRVVMLVMWSKEQEPNSPFILVDGITFTRSNGGPIRWLDVNLGPPPWYQLVLPHGNLKSNELVCVVRVIGKLLLLCSLSVTSGKVG